MIYENEFSVDFIIDDYINKLEKKAVINPKYEEILKGMKYVKEHNLGVWAATGLLRKYNLTLTI